MYWRYFRLTWMLDPWALTEPSVCALPLDVSNPENPISWIISMASWVTSPSTGICISGESKSGLVAPVVTSGSPPRPAFEDEGLLKMSGDLERSRRRWVGDREREECLRWCREDPPPPTPPGDRDRWRRRRSRDRERDRDRRWLLSPPRRPGDRDRDLGIFFNLFRNKSLKSSRFCCARVKVGNIRQLKFDETLISAFN